MTTQSITIPLPTSNPLEDTLAEPRERVHHDPVTFDRLISGDGYPPEGVPRLLGAHIRKAPTLLERFRAWCAARR